MRRLLTCALLALAALALGGSPTAVADDPPPVVLGPPPISAGADAAIRADGSSELIGVSERGAGQQIEQTITQYQRARSSVRICSVGVTGRIRVHGTGSTVNWRVTYRVGHQDVTRAVVAGGYRTASLRSGGCARRIHVVARLQPLSGTYGRTFKVRVIPVSGERDVVSTRVTVVGPLVVP
jgi:hypothetical protein